MFTCNLKHNKILTAANKMNEHFETIPA